MSVLHILNIADWAMIGAGVGISLLMMLVGSPDDEAKGDDAKPRKRQS